MSIQLKDVAVAQKNQELTVIVPVEVKNGDGSTHTENLSVIYRPITQKVLSLMLAGDVAKSLSLALIDLDLQDEGKKIEPTEELLSDLPLDFLMLVSEYVLGDSMPGKKK